MRLGAGPESAVCTSDAAAASVLAGPQAQMLETPQAQMRSQALLRLCLRNWERLTQRKRSSEEAILNAAGEAILGFWLIRGGGGAGGDAALAAEFFQNGNETLDAQQLEDRMHKVLGVHLEPAHSALLLEHLLSASACKEAPGGRPSLSAQALQEWVHKRYPQFELEQMLLSDAVQLHKIVARHLARGYGQDEPRTLIDVKGCVREAISDIANAVYAQIAQVS